MAGRRRAGANVLPRRWRVPIQQTARAVKAAENRLCQQTNE
jgi:hypothetical protein